MSDLIPTRGYKRVTVTNLCNRIEKNVELNSITERNNLVLKLEKYRTELDDLNEKISMDLWANQASAEDKAGNIAKAEEYDTRIENCLILLQDSIAAYNYRQENNNSNNSGNSDDSRHSANNPLNDSRNQRLKLPEVPLPTFRNDKSETLDFFLTTFEDVVEKYSLTQYEQFILLKKQLKGEPQILINSLSISEQSYEQARNLLQLAFGSETTKKFDAIKRLEKLSSSSGTSVYEYVGEMRLVQNLFNSLSISTDDILRYFIWNSMSVDLQTQLVYITNSNKPSLQQINDNIFGAIERSREIGERAKSASTIGKYPTSSASNLAVNVDFVSSKRQFCSLCSSTERKDSTHATKDCQKYATPEQKRRRLEIVGGCVLCGYANHRSSDCKFKFAKKCFNCNMPHMTFLCISANSNKTNSNQSKVTSNTVWTSAFNIHVGNETILPSFTCSVGNLRIRGLKDSGCQPNFISSKIVNALNLPIVHKNHVVTINGFNESQNYVTNVVTVPLTIGDRSFSIEAISVPDIRTSLTLPGLGKCVAMLKYKGYKLADEFLSDNSDTVDNFDLMLGSNNPEVLMEEQFSFGENSISVFSNTNIGILLYGNLNTILSNIDSLPPINTDYFDKFKCNSSTRTVDTYNDHSNVNANHVVINSDKSVNSKELSNALDELMRASLNYDSVCYDDSDTVTNKEAVNYVLNNCSRSVDGRLIMPLIWNKEFEHLLGENYNLSHSILFSGLKKFKNDNEKLLMIDDVFKQQLRDGVIEKVGNINCIRNQNVSFLPHMPVFKPGSLTTKVRVVFLSNLCESSLNRLTMSHNQTISPGPCLNEKITTAVTNLRFGEYLLTYDLKRAFLQIGLNEVDSNRLLFLWFKDVANNDFEVVAYRNLRLPFGLRASPAMLMLAMFKILCIDSECDSYNLKSFKRLLYALLYMDNGAYSGNLQDLSWAYNNIHSVFDPYGFHLQQITSNVRSIQLDADSRCGEETPDEVRLLGLNWQRSTDKLYSNRISLNSKANTKRSILKSIASQYDIHNFQGPILNRARIFLHKLQCDKDLGWDAKLDDKLCHEWSVISSQANKSPQIYIDRYVGERDHRYKLICFSDASKYIYAVVLYLQDLDTGRVSFLTARNRFVNSQLEKKTIPDLELQAVALGVATLIDIVDQLSGEKCVCPIKIVKLELYTDSMITLHWLNSHNYKVDKMSNMSVFKINRLQTIKSMCVNHPISFNFVSTGENPADCMTRPLSYNTLMKSCYICGPKCITDGTIPVLTVELPNPNAHFIPDSIKLHALVTTSSANNTCCVDASKYSSFRKAVNVLATVRRAIDILINRCKSNGKLSNVSLRNLNTNYIDYATKTLIRIDQKTNFPEVLNFFVNYSSSVRKNIPAIVNKLNLFIDDSGLIRVKAKMRGDSVLPVLLSKDSPVTSSIIRDFHISMAHSGCYAMLTEIRKSYWIECIFSTVKRVIKSCIVCRRLNNRTIKLNQNEYRDVRLSPEPAPFKFCFIDHLGPFNVFYGKEKQKVWLLMITCMWSRGVNIRLCDDLSVKSFLKAFQMHIFEYGLPARVFSDLGSQLTAGTSQIAEYHKSKEFTDYFDSNCIQSTKFDQYFKGNSALGSLVEICVKYCKKLLYGSIRNNILALSDFQFAICQSIHLINKRPIAFQEALRETSNLKVPDPISPELLIKGRTLDTVNVIPALDGSDSGDEDYIAKFDSSHSLRHEMAKLRKVHGNLIKRYNDEFLSQLISQSVDKADRYKPVHHHKLEVHDIVLIKDPLIKVYHYPMAIVTKVYENSIGEVTDVELFKGKTGETVKRHVSCIIPLLRPDADVSTVTAVDTTVINDPPDYALPKRRAKTEAMNRLSLMYDGD